MPNKILHRRSAVSGRPPLDTDISAGEIAINTADGLIFTKTSAGSIITVGAPNADQVDQRLLALENATPATPVTTAATWTITSTSITAAVGDNIFVDTSTASVTIILPAGTLGDTITLVDLNGTFATNNLIVSGPDLIMGLTPPLNVSTSNVTITLVYCNSTVGLKILNI